MCIVGIVCGVSADLPLLVVHSRDEFLERPVMPPIEEGDIVFARDAQEGGTWCGWNKRSGVFAALTNVRVRGVPKPTGAVSRGHLVMDVLHGRIPWSAIESACGGSESPCVVPGQALPSLSPTLPLGGHAYAPFNLIVARTGSPHTVYWLTNMGAVVHPAALPEHATPWLQLLPLPPTHAACTRLAPGIHAISNSVLNDRAWRKVGYTRERMAAMMAGLPSLAECERGGGGRAPSHPCTFPQGPPHPPTTTEAAHAQGGSHGESLLLQHVLGECVSAMTRSDPLPAGGEAEAGGGEGYGVWSPLPPSLESHLQAHVFIPHTTCLGGAAYGTRSLTLLACVGPRGVYYAHRSYDPLGGHSAGQPVQGVAVAAARPWLAGEEEERAAERAGIAQVVAHEGAGKASMHTASLQWSLFRHHAGGGHTPA